MQKQTRKALLLADAYAITFALLYLLVFYAVPLSQINNVLGNCSINSTSRLTNLIIAPVSYFELVVIAEQFNITSSAGLESIVIGNFALVGALIFLTVLYDELWIKRFKGFFSTRYVLLTTVMVTYFLGVIYWDFLHICTTGTSIIGFSLALFLSANLIIDMPFHRKKLAGKLTPGKLLFGLGYSLSVVILLLVLATYVASGLIHIVGGALFVLALWLFLRFKKHAGEGIGTTIERGLLIFVLLSAITYLLLYYSNVIGSLFVTVDVQLMVIITMFVVMQISNLKLEKETKAQTTAFTTSLSEVTSKLDRIAGGFDSLVADMKLQRLKEEERKRHLEAMKPDLYLKVKVQKMLFGLVSHYFIEIYDKKGNAENITITQYQGAAKKNIGDKPTQFDISMRKSVLIYIGDNGLEPLTTKIEVTVENREGYVYFGSLALKIQENLEQEIPVVLVTRR